MKNFFADIILSPIKAWMASSAHFWLFKKITRLGFFVWMLIPVTILEKPWVEWCMHQGWDLAIYVPVAIALGVFSVIFTLTAVLHYPSKTSPIFMSVEISKKPRLGIHMWKRFPTHEELNEMVSLSISTAASLNIPVISVLSPLFMRKGRLKLWKSMLEKSLAHYPQYRVQIEEVSPFTLSPMRSLCFSFSKRFLKFDAEGKHLPQMSTFFVQSSGFKLHVSKA